MIYDVAIVGGGIVGLATGLALTRRFPESRLLLLEKERQWASHQTGRNSGVIHSGIYYKPGSLKASLAREGNRAMVEFCREHDIPHDVCGKVIVAIEPAELPLLEALFQRSHQNGLDTSRLEATELKQIEPHVSGLAAIRVPSTGIVNYGQVSEVMARILQERGAELHTKAEVVHIETSGDIVELSTPRDTQHAHVMVNCAGLQSDRLARLAGVDPGMKIVPFRGEYYKLKAERRYLVKHLIYPVPNPNFPFLGVHFTRMIDGAVEAGPNAVLSLKREGYTRSDFNLKDFAEVVAYAGMRRLTARYWREGIQEIVRSFSKATFVRSLQRLVPEIRAEDLEPAPAGVRAQALRPDGSLVDDFHILAQRRAVHVLNAPSPAATASILIGETIVDRIAEQYPLPASHAT
jgi:L-2-hydroxyglutarate oxidase